MDAEDTDDANVGDNADMLSMLEQKSDGGDDLLVQLAAQGLDFGDQKKAKVKVYRHHDEEEKPRTTLDDLDKLTRSDDERADDEMKRMLFDSEDQKPKHSEKKHEDIGNSKTSTSSQRRPLVDKTIAQPQQNLTSEMATAMSHRCDSTDFFETAEFNDK